MGTRELSDQLPNPPQNPVENVNKQFCNEQVFAFGIKASDQERQIYVKMYLLRIKASDPLLVR